jgi:hypothetical protein
MEDFMKRIFLSFTAVMLMSCQQAPAPQTLEPIRFSGLPKIRIAASEIRVVDNYDAPLKSPNVEHMFPTPLTTSISQWSTDRLQAAGTDGIMEVTIEEASVVEVKLPKTKGLRGLFTDDQSERYDAKLRATMRLYTGNRAIAVAEGDVNVVRSRSINEKATINDRERLFHDMSKELMTQFNTQSEARLRQYFGAFLR